MFSFTQILHRNIQQRPNQDAIRFQGRSRTYIEMGDRVARLASALQEYGMGEGERVAMLSLNSANYLEYLFAVPWGGGVVNPINTRWSAEEIAYSLEDSGTSIMLVDDHFLPLMEKVRKLTPVLTTVIFSGNDTAPSDLPDYEVLIATANPMQDSSRCNDDLLGIFYTGGTTGFPKGVMLTHTNIVSSALSMATLIEMRNDGGRYLHVAPMFHLADLIFGSISFIRGYTHVVLPGFDPQKVLETITNENVTDILLVPTMLQMLLNTPSFSPTQIAPLERLFYGASPMPQSTMAMTVTQMPQVKLYQAYGMTELAPVATISPPDNHTSEGIKSGLIRSAGRAGPLQHVRVVDTDDNELPRGQVGEVIVSGPNVMVGYWNKPEATAGAIINGWMHTGDMGYMDNDGWLFIVDRSKDMIISGGENIYSAEVESVISQHPSVAQVAVIAVPSKEWGEAVHAVIVPKQGEEPTIEEIYTFCKQSIAGYKCPRSLELLKELPLSGAGKILKTELRKPHWDGHGQGVA